MGNSASTASTKPRDNNTSLSDILTDTINTTSKTLSMYSNAISFMNKEKAKICVYGYVREEEKSVSLQKYIPDSIRFLMFTFSYDGYQLLGFSKKYQSGCFKLDKNDTVAIHKKGYDIKHKYILCDVEPVTKGIHCWRVYINNHENNASNACVMWAISEIYKYSDRSFESAKQVWGGISTGYTVENGQFHYNEKMNYNINKNPYQVDMLLNCEAGNFKMGMVNNDKLKTIEFHALPKNYKYGFVPHFNNYLSGAELRCVKIPHEMFRQSVQLPFFDD